MDQSGEKSSVETFMNDPIRFFDRSITKHDIRKVTDAVNAYTQTVGIYPEKLKHELRDVLPLFGAQRLTSLGYACNVTIAMPQDAIEPLRRMAKWIVEESCDPEKVFPMWKAPNPAG